MSARTRTGRQWAAENLFHKTADEGGNGGADAPPPSDPGAWLAGLRLGEAQPADPYRIYPLLHEGPGIAPDLLLTHQAVEAELLEILEEGEGTVQALTARNRGRQPVVILEGDTVVGCKQNRVIARSVILGPGVSVRIPVGCMEQGRWAWRTQTFSSGAMRMSPTVRGKTSAEIRTGKKMRLESPTLDQGRLWNDVTRHLSCESVTSPSVDYHALIEEKGRQARERARALKPQPGQVGVLVMADGVFLGLELAGHPDTWGLLADRTLPAFLLDRLWSQEAGASAGRGRREASDWLTHLQKTRLTRGPGLGLGEEVDLEEDGLGGSGLWHEGRMVHMAVFAQ